MKNRETYVLVNVNEELVKMQVREYISQNDMCNCEKCFMDVCAIALNDLCGHYVTSTKGATIANALQTVSAENKIELTIAVSKAIEIVKNSPKHDPQ